VGIILDLNFALYLGIPQRLSGATGSFGPGQTKYGGSLIVGALLGNSRLAWKQALIWA